MLWWVTIPVGAVIVDDFKVRSKENVNAYTRILKCGTDESPENPMYLFCEWCFMAGGITPIS